MILRVVARASALTLLPAIAAFGLIGCESEDAFIPPAPPPDVSQPDVPPTPEVVTPSPSPSPTPVAQPTTQLAAPENPDPQVNAQVQQTLDTMANKGYPKASQGVWMQSGETLLANHQGTTPLPAASLTKIATTLAVLDTFGPKHQFVTQIGHTGTLENGVINGDLVIIGDRDPFFVWEDAIALGNALTNLGIKQVTGDLVIVGSFYMNYEDNPKTSGALLRQGLNVQLWPNQAYLQYETLPDDTPQPEVSASGLIKTVTTAPANLKPLLRYSSLPVAELLKKMNQYSNNPMAEMFANMVGGAGLVSQKAATVAGIPPAEIKLINGSGLGEENQMSPRAAVGLFLGIQKILQPHQMNVADVVAIVGQDEGILRSRPLPKFAVVKSGSLYVVSTLAGALPTAQNDIVWFALLNGGSYYEDFREEQETFLNQLVSQWGAVSSLPEDLQPGLSPTSGSRIENVQ
ncbi:D-alanyl-D-alanine carboxypeptidase [Roseofilum capinflatum]|uniref:D-alanyl-D-alanine carboxypeptidase n=1 Tax=Roseofilum capinflatum BLCC-M114 TaxID=3022440 RepID=A0ABT7B3W4_9CYAN|nr:D-alanyl-D-alanine carboxypeptidase [Roseofilum capinflatum]MDJ1173829.1 D-alanyl-D-alanine carboxypeptidase [Roseofilum capinflatum BLCC-M114]